MAFRQQEAILDDDGSKRELDADLIMTAAVLGFASGRLEGGVDVQFDSDSKTDQRVVTAVAKVNKALRGFLHGKTVKAGVTPDFKVGSTDFIWTSNPEIETLVAQTLRQVASSRDSPVGYQGRGAYTGFVTDSTGSRASIKSTARFNVPRGGHGDRWIPRTYAVGTDRDQGSAPWGLIGGFETIDSMVAQTHQGGGTLVGYTHGMIQAIYDCMAHGATCAPFEIAVGNHTTKLASCFPCTLFMCATGYNPSSTHLGKGESWVPFYPLGSDGKGYGDVDKAITKANLAWHSACRAHLDLGVKIMGTNNCLEDAYVDRLRLLKVFLSQRPFDPLSNPYSAANLILDAITVHDGEAERVSRTLKG